MPTKYLWLLLFVFYACESKDAGENSLSTPHDSIVKEKLILDTLHVATMIGSSSFYSFRDEYLGYDYEMVQDLSSFAEKPLKIHLAKNYDQMLQMLRSNEVDIVAYNIYESNPLKDKFKFVVHQEDSYMVLVQRIGLRTITEISELHGKTVTVNKNSIYHQRLQSLNKALGGSITIKAVSDTVSIDELIEMVGEKKIDFTIAHYKKAIQHKNYNRMLDCRIRVGFDQRNGWLIRKDNNAIRQLIASWEDATDTELLKSQLYEKYNFRNPYFIPQKIRTPRGAISPYDSYFKKYAAQINWDWQLLAAVAYHESGFDPSQSSPKGASGLMQLMPRTAAHFGLKRSDILDPEMNIDAGVQYIKSLNLLYRKVESKEERIKFILASYNSGPAHVLDAMALAKKYGKNPYIWYGHVEYYLSKKHEPEFYNDEVVKFGSFRSGVTIRYVKNTLATYRKYMGGV